jgi:hypothetical protein
MLARLRGQSKQTREGRDVTSTRRSKKRSLKLPAYERTVVPTVIAPFGYTADNQQAWRTSACHPRLAIQITSHSESVGHTYYHFDCSLSLSGDDPSVITWSGKRRLQHLRKGLHDVCKRELGSSYDKHFKSAPFAHRGGVRGTTKRLSTWCAKLADCANERIVPPIMLAQMLKLLDAPTKSRQSCCEDAGFGKSIATIDSCSNLSTTDAEQNEDLASDCSSYESDFESESCSDISGPESIAEDLQFEGDEVEEDDTPIAQYNPSLDSGYERQCMHSEMMLADIYL